MIDETDVVAADTSVSVILVVTLAIVTGSLRRSSSMLLAGEGEARSWISEGARRSELGIPMGDYRRVLDREGLLRIWRGDNVRLEID